MIVRTRGGDREFRSGPVGSSEIPLNLAALVGASGEVITLERATALPACFNAIRLIAENTGRLPLRVYSGFMEKKRTREDSWQWELLHRRPNPERSPFDFWQDVAACIESSGDAFLQKAKSRKRVEAMFLINPALVVVERDRETGELKYCITVKGERLELTRREILHIRGITFNGGDRGVSPIKSEAISSSLARYRHEGSTFRNHASPPGAIKVPGKVDRQQGARIVANWMANHSGDNIGKPALLSDGGDWVPYGMTFEDAQFIEGHEFSVKDIARIYNVPASLLNGMDTQPTEEESRRLLNFGLWGRLKRISDAVYADEDLFPAGADLYPEWYVEDFVRADALTQAQIRHFEIQDGTLLPDEARADKGRGPLKTPPPDRPGLIPQITPVGGAPNPALNGAATNGSGT